MFGIIVANKWMRANYGEPLRKWFKQQQILQIIDFGDLPVFQNATTYPCIVIAKKAKGDTSVTELMFTEVVEVKSLEFDSLKGYIDENKQRLERDSLEDKGWNLANENHQTLLKKLQKQGVSLDEYVQDKIYRGIVTGFNEAFVIDEEAKEYLIACDSKNIDVIKPYLAGKDIRRYQTPHSNKYLIFTKRGIDIEKYPCIKNHLLKYKKKLTPKPNEWEGAWEGRKPGKYAWYEIQDSIDYYQEFEKDKILWPRHKFRSYCIYI